jgi:N-acetylmuramoyl-L-alanine amidase CwlA
MTIMSKKKMSNNRLNYSANDVWAVACKAQRLNKEYIKFVPEDSKKETNREIMYRLLDESPMHLTVADKNAGVKVRQHFQALTFKLKRLQWKLQTKTLLIVN